MAAPLHRPPRLTLVGGELPSPPPDPPWHHVTLTQRRTPTAPPPDEITEELHAAPLLRRIMALEELAAELRSTLDAAVRTLTDHRITLDRLHAAQDRTPLTSAAEAVDRVEERVSELEARTDAATIDAGGAIGDEARRLAGRSLAEGWDEWVRDRSGESVIAWVVAAILTLEARGDGLGDELAELRHDWAAELRRRGARDRTLRASLAEVLAGAGGAL